MAYSHIRIEREEPVNQRRPRRGFGRIPTPDNVQRHGERLLHHLQALRESPAGLGGFDDRRLIKLTVHENLRPDDLGSINGIELVSQEDRTIVLAFASDTALAQFEARLTTLAAGQNPRRMDILYALQAFDTWTEQDRMGWALQHYGFPLSETFLLDVELWPIARAPERTALLASFANQLAQWGIQITDRVTQRSLLLMRVRVTRRQAELLLEHRDVRTVDVPPKFGLERGLLQIDVGELPPVPPSPLGAPTIAVLDTGVVAAHPLLAGAMGDAATFLRPPRDVGDTNGHGTHIAGIALYGDVELCATERRFVPQLRILSGKVLDDGADAQESFLENQVAEAVRYFLEAYGCRVFNFSYGDLNKPYRGGHLRGLAYMLDSLSRELDVLFVVPTGNFTGTDDVPADWVTEYPRYLFEDSARLIDPATALNVLTVGSLARWDIDFNSQRNADNIDFAPIARRDQPSPFTRCGPTVCGAIKPDLVSYGGNWGINPRGRHIVDTGLGELSTSSSFAVGRLLGEMVGTSYAAPHIAYAAATLLKGLPGASAALLRALLVAHARIPPPSLTLFQQTPELQVRVCGYGKVDEHSLFESLDNDVTLYAEGAIPNRHHHFYEIPIPEDFYASGKRTRELTVALAYTPVTVTTRLDYRVSKVSFHVVEAETLDAVVHTFNAANVGEEHANLPELTTGRTLSAAARSRGTVQCSTWHLKSISERRRRLRVFVVITRVDTGWGEVLSAESEKYALVVRLADKEHAEARLYAQVQAKLHARMRARVRMPG